MAREKKYGNGRLLIVDDGKGADFTHLAKIAQNAGVEPVFLANVSELGTAAEAGSIIILNEAPPEAITSAREAAASSKIICCSARSDQSFAIRCFRSGADDFILRSDGDAALLARIADVLDQQCNICVQQPEVKSGRRSRLVGESRALANIRRYIAKIAPSEVTTLITGPTGSGKEVAALELHEQSNRSGGPLIALNCAAIPDNLIEGELFGYEKGSYTGATQSYPGKLKLADGGTLFLDEIGDLSLAGQAKLLRAIETREAYRLGAQQPTRFDIRVIAATNLDLFAALQTGDFREDLYYRIAVAQVAMPPLSERREDIMPLADHFARQIAGISGIAVPDFIEPVSSAMRSYDWPGNARELRNCVELLLLASEGRMVEVGDLPRHIGAAGAHRETTADELAPADERALLFSALASCDGNKSKAAKQLKWSRMTLYRKLQLYGKPNSVPDHHAAV